MIRGWGMEGRGWGLGLGNKEDERRGDDKKL